MSQLIFEKSVPGSNSFTLPDLDIPEIDLSENIPRQFMRQQPAAMPELSEVEAVRHFTELSARAYGVDNGFYPLGSCTMKYNPKINVPPLRIPSTL